MIIYPVLSYSYVGVEKSRKIRIKRGPPFYKGGYVSIRRSFGAADTTISLHGADTRVRKAAGVQAGSEVQGSHRSRILRA